MPRAAAAISPPVEARPARRIVVVAEPEFCIACGFCADACPHDAIRITDVAEIDARLCRGCGQCIPACPRGVLEKEDKEAATARIAAAGSVPSDEDAS